ncbi:hypothetical protein TNIN_192541 [Trichonephila inaurata madagascariensis]|uniref:Uncharacterized protein n=1 Tax=Trichonephila inaurata madagascariensis TaxID=2747483 RepID=A0A8X7CEH2_9ARAC|nr:hypothetical protein TNIN_192541 [Trichonephila inaurata madagascariensis]
MLLWERSTSFFSAKFFLPFPFRLRREDDVRSLNKSVCLRTMSCFPIVLDSFKLLSEEKEQRKEVLMSGRGLSSIHHAFIRRKGVSSSSEIMNSYLAPPRRGGLRPSTN